MNQRKFIDLFSHVKRLNLDEKIVKDKRIVKANLFASENSQSALQTTISETNPKIELKKQGDIVEKIKVRCHCGRETEIVLDYHEAQVKE